MCWRTSFVVVAVLASFWLASGVPAAEPLQSEQQFEKEITVKAKLKYLLFLPAGYEQSDKAWPLLLFLHLSLIHI